MQMYLVLGSLVSIESIPKLICVQYYEMFSLPQIDTAMAMTSFRNDFVSSEINKFFNLNGRVTVNATILLLENSHTSSVTVKRDIQRKIIDVIQVLY